MGVLLFFWLLRRLDAGLDQLANRFPAAADAMSEGPVVDGSDLGRGHHGRDPLGFQLSLHANVYKLYIVDTQAITSV